LRLAAHRKDIAERMVGRDLAERVRVVDDGAEIVDRLQESLSPPTSTSAASSGASRPTTMSARATGSIRPSARERTVAPTLAPQPPQRMAMAEMSSSACRSARQQQHPASAISGRSLNLRMKRRSIQSLPAPRRRRP
jgi:hypothetical protein